MSKDTYLGNPQLKASYVPVEFTEEQVVEYLKCKDDPAYFISEYVQIVDVDRGLVPFHLRDYQEKMVDTFNDNRFVICKMARQSGKSTTIIAYLLHYILFNESTNVAVLANKKALAVELLGRLQLAYENLPSWLQQGVVKMVQRLSQPQLLVQQFVVVPTILFSLTNSPTFLQIFQSSFSIRFILPFHLGKQQKF